MVHRRRPTDTNLEEFWKIAAMLSAPPDAAVELSAWVDRDSWMLHRLESHLLQNFHGCSAPRLACKQRVREIEQTEAKSGQCVLFPQLRNVCWSNLVRIVKNRLPEGCADILEVSQVIATSLAETWCGFSLTGQHFEETILHHFASRHENPVEFVIHVNEAASVASEAPHLFSGDFRDLRAVQHLVHCTEAWCDEYRDPDRRERTDNEHHGFLHKSLAFVQIENYRVANRWYGIVGPRIARELGIELNSLI